MIPRFFDRWTSPHKRALPALGERTVWMGIVNATPDSFSDGGHFLSPEKAADHAQALVEAGADIIDIGAESTRPEAEAISADEEQARLLPVLMAVRERLPNVAISVDTYKADTAQVAVQAGADIINDIWGLKAEWKGDAHSSMAEMIARLKCPVVVMHNRVQPSKETGDNFWSALFQDMKESLSLAHSCGVPRRQMVLDIGIGFGKTFEQQVECLRESERLRAFGLPLLLGTSRKSSLVKISNGLASRDEATAASVVWAVAHGACDIVRVHDVGFVRRFEAVAEALAYKPDQT